jgi:putative spermidine/putrescine transport system permease protein
VTYPFVQLVETGLGPPGGSRNISDFFSNSANLTVLRITFVDSAIVTVIAVCAGALIAWSLRTTRNRLMRFLLLSAVFVPIWMGTIIKLYAFTVLLERLGVVNTALQRLHLISTPLTLLYTQSAVVIGMVYQMLPYSVLPLYVAFLTIDLDLIGAAESLGASRARALWSIVVPLAIPGILATVTIVYVISLGFYLTPVILGGATSPFMSSVISQDLFQFADMISASVGAIALLIGALAVVSLSYLVVGKERLRRAIE